jgi:poly-gamma-glutamate capsule biosynthesis protein CapA/YwtB (metallophosphatase superfamily)
MRPLALILRAGIVVVLVGIAVAAVVDGAPHPVVVQPAIAAGDAGRQPEATAEPKRVAVPKRQAPSALVTVAATGDIVMGSTPNLPPDGGRSFFSGVQADLAGDVVIGNLEGTLSTGGGSKCGPSSTNCYAFQTPPSYARWLKRAGFTVMSLANNHAYDFGEAGRRQTVAALDRVRVAHTGRPGQIAVQQVGDVRVAVVGFAPYPWAASLTDIPRARTLVRKASRLADVVIVTLHGGAEGTDRQRVPYGTETYLGENRGDLRRFSHAVVDAGADLVVGHGPHVLRGMEWYKKRLIAYSLGNFGGYKVFALGGPLSTSGILRVTLRGDGSFESGTLVPTRLVGDGVPALDPSEAAHGVVRTLSRQDFGPRAVKIDRNGVLSR